MWSVHPNSCAGARQSIIAFAGGPLWIFELQATGNSSRQYIANTYQKASTKQPIRRPPHPTVFHNNLCTTSHIGTPRHDPSDFLEAAIMSDGALKPEKDFSKEVDKQIPEAEALAKV